MYLIIVFILVFIVILGIYRYVYSKREGFNNLVDVLPIQISSDNSTISIPNTIRGNNGDNITFVGNIQAPTGTTNTIQSTGDATFNNLTVNGDSQLNQTTFKGNTRITGNNIFEFGADIIKSNPMNGTLSYKTMENKDALDIVGAENGGSRKVHLWDNVEIAQNLHVKGSIKIGTETNYWTIRTRSDGRLEFLYKDTGQENFDNDAGHILMDTVGNLWLSRSLYRGWVADNLQGINNKEVILPYLACS
jgi:hypothetical protein